VEEKTPKNRKETESGRDQTAENPPLATVNTHLTRGTFARSEDKPVRLRSVDGTREAADERR
jgi:hypothetical protein